jgi:tetratricopeptide (TPR) repeat protein
MVGVRLRLPGVPSYEMISKMKSILFALSLTTLLLAQGGRPQASEGMRQAIQLDLAGDYAQARALLQKEIDTAAAPLLKANAQRAMAMSYAFERNCAKTIEYEQMVISYWATREKEEPKNAFYQQGEMANEAARVCIDSGDINAAESWYAKGTELGLKEPEISADRKALWEFRLEHARARVAARRGKKALAETHIAAAKQALDKMVDLRKQQEPFFPYLTGYVALYLGDPAKALSDFEKANANDAFIQCLKADALEKLGRKEEAMELYRKAAATRGHNPPAAYAVPLAKKKLA